MNATEDRLKIGVEIGREVGLDDAADHLEQFLDGGGNDRTVHRDDARKDPFIQRAEKQNRQRFEEKTFIGETGNPKLNAKLRNMKDGETIEFDDEWDVKQSDAQQVSDNLRSGGLDNALTYGRQRLKSASRVRATRKGNKISFEGTVSHNADDDYDFHDGRTGDYIGAKDLQDSGRGKPFKTKRRWQQRVSGDVEIDGWEEGKGHVLKRPKMTWDDFDE